MPSKYAMTSNVYGDENKHYNVTGTSSEIYDCLVSNTIAKMNAVVWWGFNSEIETKSWHA